MMDEVDEWEQLELEEEELEEEEENRCLDCVWWMDIADHTKEYYPDMDCCAPRFDLCCTCIHQIECKEGKLKGCVYE